MAESQVSSAEQTASAATRHLCAGVYLDREFRDMVLREVRHNASRRVPPSYGFDIVPVVQHAWQAWWLETAGQALMVFVLVTALAVDASAVIITACAGGACLLGQLILRRAPEIARLHARSASTHWLRRSVRGGERDRYRELSRLLVVCLGGCLLLLEIGEVAASARGSADSGVLAAAALLLMLVAASVASTTARQIALNRTYSGESLRPTRLSRRLTVLDQQQSCDYVIYRKPPLDEGSKDFKPLSWDRELTRFVGGGKLVHRWLPPLSVQLLRPGEGSLLDREYPVPPFQAHELVEYLKDAMEPVGNGNDPTSLRGFQVRDRLYVAETDVPVERGFLERPCIPQEINRIIDNPHDTARHYLEIQVSTEGEVVTTIFLRVTIRGRTLSLDFATCALTRTPSEYQILRQYAETGAGAVFRAALRGVVFLPRSLSELWRLSRAPWVLARAAWAIRDRTLIPHRGLLIGSRLSVREEKAEEWDGAELDKITIYDEMKIVEQRLLRATEDFLEREAVDTSIFRRRVFSIINTGVLNMGKLEMNQPAVGTNAQVHHHAADSDGDNQPPDGAE